jgi:hypothetical protein
VVPATSTAVSDNINAGEVICQCISRVLATNYKIYPKLFEYHCRVNRLGESNGSFNPHDTFCTCPS